MPMCPQGVNALQSKLVAGSRCRKWQHDGDQQHLCRRWFISTKKRSHDCKVKNMSPVASLP